MCQYIIRVFVFLFLLFAFTNFHSKINYSIEIYILKNTKSQLSRNGLGAEFKIKKENLPALPFIRDDEIESFDTNTFEIRFSKEAAERIGTLKPNLPIGIPFVLTVDQQPVLTGYFFSTISSFGCASYVLFNNKNQTQHLLKGLPEHLYKNFISEERDNPLFIQALERTGRLK